MKDNPFKLFQTMVSAYIYNANYRILQEMGAGNAMLKEYEKYKEAPLEELQKAGAYVAAWQQAKVAEITKEAYLEAEKRHEQEKADYEKQQGLCFVAADRKKYLS